MLVKYYDGKYLVEFLVKLIKLRGLCHLVLVHKERRLYLFIPSASQEVQAVRNKRLIKVNTIARQVVASVTGDLSTCKKKLRDLALSGRTARPTPIKIHSV